MGDSAGSIEGDGMRRGAWRPVLGGVGALLASVLLLAALAGSTVSSARTGGSLRCPPLRLPATPSNLFHPPARALLACVGTTPITGAVFDGEFRITHHAAPAPLALYEAMLVLVVRDWAAGEARGRHIAVTGAAVRQDLTRWTRKHYPHKGQLQRHLKQTGDTMADVLAGLRFQLLNAAIEKRVKGHGSRQVRQRRLDRFRQRFFRRWIARTSCDKAFWVPLCGHSLGVKPGSTAAVGGHPTGMAIDAATETIYVANGGSDMLSLIDGKTCNAAIRRGCAHAKAVPSGGSSPVGVAIDQATNTIYVANAGSGTVSVIDGATCNAANTRGCAKKPAKVRVDGGSELLAVDPSTDTIYVPNLFTNTVAVIDGRMCNATNTSGCAQNPTEVKVGSGPEVVAVDPATDTIYVATSGASTISMIDGKTCNGADTSSCGKTQAKAAVGNGPLGLAIDPATDSVYVGNAASNTVSVLNGGTCNATSTAGCAARTVRVGTDPRGLAFDPATRTVYVVNAGSNDLSLLNARTCNDMTASGCASLKTTPVDASPRRIAIDVKTHTVYVSNALSADISLIDATKCSVANTHGC
jgi:YVTN family beta-propeller protein